MKRELNLISDIDMTCVKHALQTVLKRLEMVAKGNPIFFYLSRACIVVINFKDVSNDVLVF